MKALLITLRFVFWSAVLILMAYWASQPSPLWRSLLDLLAAIVALSKAASAYGELEALWK